jgi:hypothetical protein
MNRKRSGRNVIGAVLVVTLSACFTAAAFAGPVERAQAKRIHDRIAGVPPGAAVLDQMEALIVANPATGPAAAARIAMQAPLLHHCPQELGHALDQPRPDGICAAE